MIYFLGGKLVILYTLGLFSCTVSFTENVRGVQNGKLVWFSIPSSSVLHEFVITSAAWSCPPVTRMTSTYPTWTTWRAAPHLYVTSPRSPHSETGRCVTSILRSGERRTKNFCGLSTVSVLSYVIYFNAQEELNFFYLFIALQGLFCVSFCNIFLHITKVRDYMPFYWDSSALEHLTIQTVIEIFLVNL